MRKSFPYPTTPDQIPVEAKPQYSPYHKSYYYACPDACWQEHLKAWGNARSQTKDKDSLPQPMPQGHCCFETPMHYGHVTLGCNDPEQIRQAIEHCVRADLNGGGWLRDVQPDKAEAIIQATVKAKMAGIDTGAMPYVACVAEWIA